MNLKFLVAIISIILALGLVGCGGGDSNDNTSQQNGTESTTSDQETGQDQTEDSSEQSEMGNQLDEALVEQGMMLASAQGCIACHSSDGSTSVGPTWLGLYGSERTFTDGTTAMADEDYLRQSMIEPNAQVVEDYQPNLMISYESLEDSQINALIEYMNSLAE